MHILSKAKQKLNSGTRFFFSSSHASKWSHSFDQFLLIIPNLTGFAMQFPKNFTWHYRRVFLYKNENTEPELQFKQIRSFVPFWTTYCTFIPIHTGKLQLSPTTFYLLFLKIDIPFTIRYYSRFSDNSQVKDSCIRYKYILLEVVQWSTMNHSGTP